MNKNVTTNNTTKQKQHIHHNQLNMKIAIIKILIINIINQVYLVIIVLIKHLKKRKKTYLKEINKLNLIKKEEILTVLLSSQFLIMNK